MHSKCSWISKLYWISSLTAGSFTGYTTYMMCAVMFQWCLLSSAWKAASVGNLLFDHKELDRWKWAATTIKAISHLRLCCCTEYYGRCYGAEGIKPAALWIWYSSVCTWETNLVANVSVTLIRLFQQLCHWMAGCLLPYATFGYSVTDILSGSQKAVFVAAILWFQGKVADIDNALASPDKPYRYRVNIMTPITKLYWSMALCNNKRTTNSCVQFCPHQA